MYVLRDTAQSTPVADSERGERIQERLERLGISDREFHETTGIDRKTLRRAVSAEGNVRSSTYAAIEAELDKLEEKVAGPQQRPVGDDLVEFTIEGNFGVRAVVKGPVRDMAALQDAVTRLVRDMQNPDQRDDSEKS